jgi:hypothetical protein
MADDAPPGLRRSTRTRTPRQTFEETEYAIDILHTQLRSADSLEDFMASLFIFYRPACHQPAKWRGTGRNKYRGVFRLVEERCGEVGLSPDAVLGMAHAYAQGDFDRVAARRLFSNSRWGAAGVREFERTVGLLGKDSDDEADEDDEDEDEDEEDEEEEEEDEEQEDEDETYDDEAEEEEDDEDDDAEDEEEGEGDEEEEPEFDFDEEDTTPSGAAGSEAGAAPRPT